MPLAVNTEISKCWTTCVCRMCATAPPCAQLLACRFKYILIRVTIDGRSKLIVRGSSCAEYHNDILRMTAAEASLPIRALHALGGGRIDHDKANKRVHVYGYSMAFGPAVHEITAEIVRRKYPWYDQSSLTVSYEGY